MLAEERGVATAGLQDLPLDSLLAPMFEQIAGRHELGRWSYVAFDGFGTPTFQSESSTTLDACGLMWVLRPSFRSLPKELRHYRDGPDCVPASLSLRLGDEELSYELMIDPEDSVDLTLGESRRWAGVYAVCQDKDHVAWRYGVAGAFTLKR